MTDQRRELGRRGENLAEAHLVKIGYKIVERNHVNAIGEIDLVALDGPAVVLVEVRTRTRNRSGLAPAETVDYRKQLKLTRVGQLYLISKGWASRPARFDVVEVISPPGSAPLIRHIINAFDEVSR